MTSAARPVRGGWILSAYCLLAALFVALPIASGFVFSLSESRFPVLPPEELSLRWFREAWNDPKDAAALRRTLGVGVLAAAAATVLGFGAAYADYRYRFRGRAVFLSLLLLPPTVPPVILGLAMLAYLSRAGLSGGTAAVWISHTVMCVPFSMAVIRLRLHQMDENLEAAAWNLGAGQWAAMRAVVLPFARPALAASFLLSLAVSFDEFTVAWFVSGVSETLPVRVLNFLQGQVSPRINVIGAATFTATMTMAFAAAVLVSRGGK